MVKKLITFPPVALALEMAHTYIRVGVARSAAALSYFLILTLFPMLLCVNYFIGLFHLDLEQMCIRDRRHVAALLEMGQGAAAPRFSLAGQQGVIVGQPDGGAGLLNACLLYTSTSKQEPK